MTLADVIGDIDCLLNQKFVYWAPTSPTSGTSGAAGYSSGIEVAGRWEDSQQIVRNANGDDVVSDGRVYYDGEEQTLIRLGRVVQKRLNELTSAQIADPSTVRDALEIFDANVSPSVDATESLGKAELKMKRR